MTKLILLTQSQHAIVDDEDYDFLMQWKWYYNGRYAARQETIQRGSRQTYKQRLVHMHRAILNAPSDQHVDHQDGNRLNNTRSNLRLCSPSENLANQSKRTHSASSQYKGVSWNKQTGKWNARIRYTHLGSFASEADAAHAYDAAARKLFGEFARPNFPEE